MPLETRSAETYVLWYDNTPGFVTSMALVNASDRQADIQTTIRDESGAVLGANTVALPARGHAAFELARPDRFPATANRRGTVEFRAPEGGQISMLGLRFNADSFTTIPVLPKAAGLGGAAAGVFGNAGSMAQLAIRGVLENQHHAGTPGTATATARLNFFDESGSPFATAQLPGLALGPADRHYTDRTLAAGASLVIESQGTGN